jgi:hypothetical protein
MAVPPNESPATINGPTGQAASAVVTLPPRFEDSLADFIRAAGFDAFEISHDVRSYADEDSHQSWSNHVFSVTVPGADRTARSRLMLQLLDYLGEHEDERVRKGVIVRVR